MIVFVSLFALAFSAGCGDYSDCVACLQSSSYSCNWSVSRLRRNLAASCVDARRQLTEVDSRRNLATVYSEYSECPAETCDSYTDCTTCAQNDCVWTVTRRSVLDVLAGRRSLGASCGDPARRRQLATYYDNSNYADCPAATCDSHTDCVACAQAGCEWTEGRRRKLAGETTDSYGSSGTCGDLSSSSYDGRRTLAGITDYSYCPAEEAVVTEAPEPLEERWWFVMGLVIGIGFIVWLGVGFMIYGSEVDDHEGDWRLVKQQTMDFSHAHEDHGHGDHGAGGHGHDSHGHDGGHHDHGHHDHGHHDHGHHDHGHHDHGHHDHGHHDHGKRAPNSGHGGHHDPHGHNSHGGHRGPSHGHSNHGHSNHGHSRGYDREYITE